MTEIERDGVLRALRSSLFAAVLAWGAGAAAVIYYSGQVVARLDQVERDLEKAETRIDSVDKRAGAVDATLAALAARLDELFRLTARIDARLTPEHRQ